LELRLAGSGDREFRGAGTFRPRRWSSMTRCARCSRRVCNAQQ
jgi:hypothetical protein